MIKWLRFWWIRYRAPKAALLPYFIEGVKFKLGDIIATPYNSLEYVGRGKVMQLQKEHGIELDQGKRIKNKLLRPTVVRNVVIFRNGKAIHEIVNKIDK